MLSKFCQYLKPISISLSPNAERDDVLLALKLFFQPWHWKNGEAIQNLEAEFKNYLGVRHACSFNSGRSALIAILESLDLPEGSEVLLQAFTCNAVPNPVFWSKLKPIYVDCGEDFNIDTEDLKRKITSHSVVVIVQHTFGLSADMDKIQEICRHGSADSPQGDLVLIEDCAHSLGATYGGRKVGTFGKAAFFSFSRDKVISSVYGGMAVTNDDELAEKLREYQEKIGYPSYYWIARQLLHPILMNWLILPTYRVFGKYLLVLFQWLGILSKAVDWREKRGQKPSYFPKRMPDVLAVLALHQFRKLERFNEYRKKIAKIYYEHFADFNLQHKRGLTPLMLEEILEDRAHIFLRFPVRHPRAHEIIKKCWENNILIGDWYTTAIAPHDTQLDRLYYKEGSCPLAEKLAKETFNLPTHINISEKEAGKIIGFLKSLLTI